MSLQPGGRFLLRCRTVQTLPDFIGEQDPLANALPRTSKIVEEPVEVVENTKRLDCTATLAHLAVCTDGVYIRHGPNCQIGSGPPYLTDCDIRVMQIVNLGSGTKSLRGSP